MTVSRVMNHPELVTQELKDLVYQAMKELDYRPNTVAKALAKNRTLVIKVLILEEMDTTEPYFMNLLMGIAKELDRYQYALQLVTENSINLGDCDGYIITGMKEEDFEWIKKIKKPVVLFGENTYGVPYVDSNNYAATRFATKYAARCGYQNIYFIGIDVPEKFAKSREQGYRDAMELLHLSPKVYKVGNHSSSAARLIEHIGTLEEGTCFVCASDRIAIGIERQLSQEGKQIPKDYGIIGFDGVFLDQIASPKLTTMKQDLIKMGKLCVEQLMKLLEGETLKEPFVMHEAKMVVRGTTK